MAVLTLVARARTAILFANCRFMSLNQSRVGKQTDVSFLSVCLIDIACKFIFFFLPSDYVTHRETNGIHCSLLACFCNHAAEFHQRRMRNAINKVIRTLIQSLH